MPIREFLDGQKFDPETTRVMGLAFEIARAALRLEPQDKVAKEDLATRIIALAQRGERDPERMSDSVLNELRRPDRAGGLS